MEKLRHVGIVTALGLFIGISLFPLRGQTEMVKLHLEQLTEEADTIVQGSVTRLESAWNDQRTEIYTTITMLVEEVIKGAPSSEVTFRVAGGTIGNLSMFTSDDPLFEEGEQAIVFLDTKGDVARIVGLHQGKYGVREGRVVKNEKLLPTAIFIETIHAAKQEKPIQ